MDKKNKEKEDMFNVKAKMLLMEMLSFKYKVDFHLPPFMGRMNPFFVIPKKYIKTNRMKDIIKELSDAGLNIKQFDVKNNLFLEIQGI